MSAIGAMFAPHHQQVADELVRVCRPGGTIGLLSWTPEGMIGALFRLMGPFEPPPPPGAQPPPLWGGEEHVRELFGDRVEFRSVERDVLEVTAFERPQDYATHFKERYGPTIAAQRTLATTGARRSSWRRSTGSATSGTAARPTAHGSRCSTCSRWGQEGSDPSHPVDPDDAAHARLDRPPAARLLEEGPGRRAAGVGEPGLGRKPGE